ncbi:MAG: glycosyltransferase family 39 protein [Planctomycetota bacterium]
MSVPPLRGIHALALGAILLLAGFLRFAAIDRELPHRHESDPHLVQLFQAYEQDPAIVRHTEYVIRYPSLVPRLLSFLPYPEMPARASGPGSEAEHLEAASFPYVRVRAAAAVFSIVGVLLTWFLARRFLAPGAACVAAFLMATSLLSILFAQQARPHAFQATMALATVLLSLRVLSEPSFSRILLAALAAAGAAACLQNGMLAMIPLACGVFLGLRESREAGKRGLLRSLAAAGVVAGAASAAGLAFYPGALRVDSRGIHLGDEGGTHSLWFRFMDLLSLPGLRAGGQGLWAHDPVLAILSIVGAILGIVGLARTWKSTARARRLELALIASYVLPYVAVLAPNIKTYERFLLPIYPYLACLAAAAVARIVGRAGGIKPTWLRITVGAAAGILCLAPHAYIALRYARAARAPDRLELAAAWIESKVDPGAVILTTPGTVLPLLYDPELVRIDLEDDGAHTLPWLAYQGAIQPGADPARRWKVRIFPSSRATGPERMDPEQVDSWIAENGFDYAVLETSRKMRNLAVTRALADSVRNRGQLMYAVEGETPSLPGLGPGEWQGASEYATWLLGADAFGPGIEIYRLRRER